MIAPRPVCVVAPVGRVTRIQPQTGRLWERGRERHRPAAAAGHGRRRPRRLARRSAACSIEALAEEYGTPLFVYDEAHLRARCREAVAAFGPDRVIYATKAFLCRAMARLAYDEGMLLDVATGGELHVALAAGVPARRCTLHGNNKSGAELRQAIEAGVRHIVVDSFDELDRLDVLHGEPASARRPTSCCGSRRASTPTPTSSSRPARTTRSSASTWRTVTRCVPSTAPAGRSAMDLVGLHCHIGSNVFEASSFAKAAEVMADFAVPLDLPELVLGGGLGVAYVEGEEAPSITQWGSVLLDACDALGVRSRVSVEPGRCDRGVGRDDRVHGRHDQGHPGRAHLRLGRRRHERQPAAGALRLRLRVVPPAGGRRRTRSDRSSRRQALRVGRRARVRRAAAGDLAVGDLLAMPVTGAYGHSMGSNYNKITRPPVVFVADGDARLVVRRETFDDLLATDLG